MSELVSVIIPTYNRPLFLERAINSVLNQSYKNIEIVVVDDNGNNIVSRNETKLIMNTFVKKSNVKYIMNEKNVGGAESRNIGVKSAGGQFISFLDDDDMYDENKILEQIRVFQKDPKVDVCYCGMTYFNSENKIIGSRSIYLEGSENLLKNHLFRPITGTPALLIKKSVFDELKGFDNLRRYQDANLIFKILSHKYTLKSTRSELVKVYIHDQERISTTGNWIEMEMDYILNAMKYIDKLSYKNAKLLIDKYHIQSCFIKEKFIFKRALKLIATLKGRLFILQNLLGILNYYRKS